MLLSEIYLAHQGEGEYCGTPCVFIRLHGCPVHCVWCDTAFTWDGTEKGTDLSIDQIIERVTAAKPACPHFVITGGEPTMHAGLPALIDALGRSFVHHEMPTIVEIETAGVFVKPKLKLPKHVEVCWNVSPKMPSAHARMEPDPVVVNSYLGLEPNEMTVLKIVVANDGDWLAMKKLTELLEVGEDAVTLMAEGMTRDAQQIRLGWLLNKCRDGRHLFRITPRMHVHAFDHKRGV